MTAGETRADPSPWTLDSLHEHLLALDKGLDLRYQQRFDAQEHAVQLALEAVHKTFTMLLDERNLRYEQHHQEATSHLHEIAIERDRRYESRWVAQEHAVTVALAAVDKEFHEHLTQARLEAAAALSATEKAIKAALEASEKAISKAETANEKRFEAVNAFREQLREQTMAFIGRREAETIMAGLAEKVAANTSRLGTAVQRVDLEAAVTLASNGLAAHLKASDARFDLITGRLSSLNEEIIALKIIQSRMGALEEAVQTLKEQADRDNGRAVGHQALWGYMVGAVGLVLTVVTLVNVLVAN